MRSIHVEVRQAVIAGIAADLNDDEVSVTYGWQGSDDTRSRKQIFTSNARADHEVAALKAGRNFRNERMQFDITVMVEAIGEKPEEAEGQAMDLGEVVEEFIADHKSNELAVEGLNWMRVSAFASDYRIADGTGSIAIATYTVTYDARLT